MKSNAISWSFQGHPNCEDSLPLQTINSSQLLYTSILKHIFEYNYQHMRIELHHEDTALTTNFVLRNTLDEGSSITSLYVLPFGHNNPDR
jgi:hypothetical protein